MLTRPDLMVGAGMLLALTVLPVGAAPAASPALCQAQIAKADQPQSQAQVDACAPWRKTRAAALNKAAQACHAAHAKDANLNACDGADAAAQRFWEEAQELESAGNKP